MIFRQSRLQQLSGNRKKGVFEGPFFYVYREIKLVLVKKNKISAFCPIIDAFFLCFFVNLQRKTLIL